MKLNNLAFAAILFISINIGCIPGLTVKSVIDIVDDVVVAVQLIDTAWNAFCYAEPSICNSAFNDYNSKKAFVLSKSRDAKIEFGVTSYADAKAGYESLEEMLVNLGVIHTQNKAGIQKTAKFSPLFVKSPF